MINLVLDDIEVDTSILCNADMNDSGDINIQDIILLINQILEY